MLKYQRLYYEMFADNVLCDSGLLFYSEKKFHCKSSWKDFRKVETNCSDWVKECECFGLGDEEETEGNVDGLVWNNSWRPE